MSSSHEEQMAKEEEAAKPKGSKEFDEEELLKKIEQMAPYERLNFLRREFDLGRNPQKSKNAAINFDDEDEILNDFDPGKIVLITAKQRDFLLQHLKAKPLNQKAIEDELEEDAKAAAQMPGRAFSARGGFPSIHRVDSVYSSTSTHQGGSLHIKGFGEGHNFKYDEDNSLSRKNRFNGSVNDNYAQGSQFSYKINMDNSESQMDS